MEGKPMKKLIIVLIGAVLSLCMFGCSGGQLGSSSTAGTMTVSYPDSWEHSDGGSGMQILGTDASTVTVLKPSSDSESMFAIADISDSGIGFADMKDTLEQAVANANGTVEIVTIDGKEAIRMEGTSNDGNKTIAVVSQDGDTVSGAFIAGFSEDDYSANKDVYDAVLGSIKLK